MNMKPGFDYESYDGAYQYRALYHGSPVQRFWHRMRWELALKSDLLTPNNLVVDLGCGSGNGAFYFAQVAENVIGLDISSHAIKFCRDRQLDECVANALFVKIEANGKLPIAGHCIDCVLCSEVLEHLQTDVLKRLLIEVFRILKPGGKFWVTTPNVWSTWLILEKTLDWLRLVPALQEQHVQNFHTKELVDALRESGFQIESFGEMYFISPFLALISESMASLVFDWELHQRSLPKMISYVVCRK